MNVRFGFRNLTFPGPDLGDLRDSSALLDELPALRARMAEDGYLLLRGLIDRAVVQQARETVLSYMQARDALTPDTPLLEGVMPKGGHGVRMMGWDGIAHHADVLAVLEHEWLYDFFERYFGEAALTFPYKWLRAVGNEAYTGAHMDTVYMGRGSARLHTVWIPFGDIPVDQGTLAMCAGSNHLAGFERLRQTYGRMDVDRDGVEGWFSRDPMEISERFGGQWLTSAFSMGDVILFGMHTMHASTTNLSNRFRLSCDVRYQPASDPVDSRWIRRVLDTLPPERRGLLRRCATNGGCEVYYFSRQLRIITAADRALHPMRQVEEEQDNDRSTQSRLEPLKSLPRNVWVMTLTSFFMDVSSEMILTLLPLFLANVLGAPAAIIGLIEGIAETTSSLLKIASGWLSDKLQQRKWLAVAGYGLSAIAKPFLYIVSGWGGVLAVRFTDRVGKGIRTSPRDALIADSITPKHRGLAFGLHRAGDTAGAVIGLMIALVVVLVMQVAVARSDAADLSDPGDYQRYPGLSGGDHAGPGRARCRHPTRKRRLCA